MVVDWLDCRRVILMERRKLATGKQERWWMVGPLDWIGRVRSMAPRSYSQVKPLVVPLAPPTSIDFSSNLQPFRASRSVTEMEISTNLPLEQASRHFQRRVQESSYRVRREISTGQERQVAARASSISRSLEQWSIITLLHWIPTSTIWIQIVRLLRMCKQEIKNNL